MFRSMSFIEVTAVFEICNFVTHYSSHTNKCLTHTYVPGLSASGRRGRGQKLLLLHLLLISTLVELRYYVGSLPFSGASVVWGSVVGSTSICM